MGNSFRSVDVKCPFYHQDDCKNCLTCEGIVADQIFQWKFRRKEDLKCQMEIFCCQNFKCCEMYRMIMDAKY